MQGRVPPGTEETQWHNPRPLSPLAGLAELFNALTQR
jgi:hypothetical protein